MANVKVRLKDASQNVLHPETEWSLVQDRPSITISTSNGQKEVWSATTTSVVGVKTLYLASPEGSVKINGGRVYINDKRPFTVRHIMNIGGCEFEIFDDQDKELTLSDVKSIMGSHFLPASGYDSTNKRMFYSVRYNLNGFYASYVKFTNGGPDAGAPTNLGDNVTEIARYVLK